MKNYLLPNDKNYAHKTYYVDGNYHSHEEIIKAVQKWRLDFERVCPLNFISSIPGSGKTEWAINRMLKNAKEKKGVYLYVSPTVELIDQIMSNEMVKDSFIKKGNFHRIVFDNPLTHDYNFGITINSRSVDSIRLEFIKKFKKAKLGDSFLITHATFLNLKDVLKCNENHPIYVIFDEDCEMVKDIRTTEFSLSLDEKNLLTHVLLEETDLNLSSINEGNPVYRVNLVDVKRITRLASQNFFSYEDSKIIEFLSNKKISVYAIHQGESAKSKTIKFTLVSLISENLFVGFKSVTVLNSYFEKSMMYHILNKRHVVIDRSSVLDTSSRNKMLGNRINNLAIYPLLNGSTGLSKNSLTNYISLNENAHAVLLQFYKKLCYFSRKRISVELFLTAVQHNVLFNKLDSRTNISVQFFKDIFPSYEFPSKNNKNQSYRLIVKYLDKIFSHLITENNRFSYQLPVLGAMNTAMSIIKAMKNVNNHEDINLVIKKNFPYSKFNRVNAMYATPTLFITNKNSLGKLVKSSYSHLTSLTSMSVKSHGLNGYEDNNAVIYLAALNPSPVLKTFLGSLIPDYSFKEHWVISTILQCLYRTSLRSPHRNDMIHLVVPNLDIAKSIKKRLDDVPTIHFVDDSKQCRLVTPSTFIDLDEKKELFSQLNLKYHRQFYESSIDKNRHKKRVEKLEKLARVEQAKNYQKVKVEPEKEKIMIRRKVEELLQTAHKDSLIPISKVELKAFEDKRRRTLRMLEDKYSLDAIHEEIIEKELEQEMIRWVEKRRVRAAKKTQISTKDVK